MITLAIIEIANNEIIRSANVVLLLSFLEE